MLRLERIKVQNKTNTVFVNHPNKTCGQLRRTRINIYM